MDAKTNVEKLKKMAGVVRIGGKGSVRRKKKVGHKITTTYDKRLQNILKRIGLNKIPQIEEVNIYKDDTIIKFLNPKVEASISGNTWVVTGSPQTNLEVTLPNIINRSEAGPIAGHMTTIIAEYVWLDRVQGVAQPFWRHTTK